MNNIYFRPNICGRLQKAEEIKGLSFYFWNLLHLQARIFPHVILFSGFVSLPLFHSGNSPLINISYISPEKLENEQKHL